MKTTRRAKAFLSIVLVITMLMSVAALGLASVSAADSLALTYSFKYQNAGYAEGRVRLTAGSSADYGNYYLYWADDTKALDGYAEIATLNLNQDSKSFAFDEFTAIPADATKLIAIKSATAPTTKTVAAAAAVYDIPESKQFKYASSEVEYNFQTLSDVHIDSGGFYEYAEENLASALEAATQRDADFVTICGDVMNGNNGTNNYEKEWGMYLSVVASSRFTNPIYEVNGNHETYFSNSSSDPYTFGLNLYKIATGLGVDTEKMQSEPYYEVTAPNGDHHIFMAMELITKNESPAASNAFTDAQMDWLEDLLDKYDGDGQRIFIFEHAPFKGYGAGDNKETPHYSAALTDDYPVVRRFKSLLEEHKDVVLFSGHTHIDFKYKYNIDNEDGNTAYTVHVPSTASPTQVNSSGGLDYPQSNTTSQGYFTDVYEDAVILNGTDLIKNQILPAYTYLIDYSGEELIEGDDVGGGDTYEKVNVTVDVSALSDNPVGVKVKLYGADDNTITDEVTMTKNADGTYSAKVSTEFTKMKFLVNAGTGYSPSAEYAVANCKVVIGGIKVEVALGDIKTTSGGSCTGWSSVNTYAWNKGSNQNEGGWPGSTMTKAANGKYVALLPGNSNPDMIIFNNGSAQTDDLTITPYIVGTFEDSYIIVGEENPTEPSSTAPTEPNPTTAPTEPNSDPTEPSSTAPTEPNSDPTEPNSDPTEPNPTTVPTEPDTDPTEPGSTAPTEPATKDEYMYGDADLDGKVTVKDATTVQKHAADMITLEGKAFTQGNVSGDKAVNVRDATYIQKYVAELIDSFPVDDKAEIAAVGASSADLTTLLSSVKKTLGDEGYYASYDAYMALKKAYYNYKDMTVSSMSATEIDTAYSEINTALTNYNKMKTNNPSHIAGVKASVTDRYLVGSFNGWDTTANEFLPKSAGDSTVYVSLELAANTKYEFKIIRQGTWTSCKDTLSITDSVSGLTFSSSISGNTTITTKKAGVYVFAFGMNNSQLSVTYP